VLRRKAAKVAKVDASIQRLIDDMIDSMHAAGGVGLAAPQIGRSLRVVVIEVPPASPEDGPASPEEKPETIVLINPQIVRRSGHGEVTERVPLRPAIGPTLPALQGDGQALTDGREIRVKEEDLLAQALEHEVDHVNGVVYVDYLRARTS
jgi:peptide deformylase